MWRSFLGDPGRVRHNEPDTYRRDLVADLRATVARYPADRDLEAMVAELRIRSKPFATLWNEAGVARHGSERKTIDHPELGAIELDCDVLTDTEFDLRLIIFSAPPRSTAKDQLRLLTVLGSQTMGTR